MQSLFKKSTGTKWKPTSKVLNTGNRWSWLEQITTWIPAFLQDKVNAFNTCFENTFPSEKEPKAQDPCQLILSRADGCNFFKDTNLFRAPESNSVTGHFPKMSLAQLVVCLLFTDALFTHTITRIRHYVRLLYILYYTTGTVQHVLHWLLLLSSVYNL